MSLLIKGMEMPQRCRDCCFAGFVFTCHLAGKTHDDVLRTRPGWCPLVPLPEKHGRLIDADAPVRVVWSDGTIHDTTVSRLLMMHSLIDFPKTIVPAEGGTE